MIQLITLGGCSLRRNGEALSGLAAHKQKVALLCYLAIEGPVARDGLLALFWPERQEERARHSLSQVLYALRKELGEDFVDVVGDRIGLVPGTVSVDVHEMEAAAESERWEDAVQLYRGPFLDRFYLPDTPGFDEWQSRTRAWVGSLARKAFGKVIASRTVGRDATGALEVAWRWAKLEPLEDEAQHALIALLALSGDRSKALEQYEAHKGRLARDLDVEPLEETVALVEGVRAGALPESPLLGGMQTAAPTPGAPQASPKINAGRDVATEAALTPDIDRLLREELSPRLEIVRKLAESSTTRVYLAREPELKRLVAVKVFSPKLAPDRRARLRFEREVQVIASLSHPNIVALHWAGALSVGLPYFVMQYVEGRSMADKLRAEGKLSVSEARRALADVAAALAAAHRRGIVHRDVQPANVLYEEETGRVLLADFGIAAILASAQYRPVKITESGELVGDPAWMSPEQLKAEEITERSDVYNLGLLGYNLLTEEGPYEANLSRELYAAHVHGNPRKLSALRPDVDPDFEDLLKHCLAKESRHRPSASHVVRVLSPTPSESPMRVAESSGFFPRLAARRVPHWLAAYLAGGFGLVELIDQLVGRGVLGEVVYSAALVTYFLGAPAVFVVAWYHGKMGRQRIEKTEYWLLGALALVWLLGMAAVLLA